MALAGRAWDENGPHYVLDHLPRPGLLVCVHASQRDSSGRQSATGGHDEDMRTQEEEGLEEALACLSLSLRDYEEEESALPPPPPPLRCSPFLTQQGNSPSPLPSPLCRRPPPLSRPPSCLSLPRLSFSQRILEERLADGLKSATSGDRGLPRTGAIRKHLFPSFSSPSLGLHQKSKASGK